MSRNYNNNNKPKPKPFCKVCADAGKSDTAHFVRLNPDPNSQVICPTLLALECRYCYRNGHTVKYCPVLKQNEKDRLRQDRQQRHVIAPVVAKPATIQNNNAFAILQNESDDDDEQTWTQPPVEHFPSLSAVAPSLKEAQTQNNSWASMAASVAHIPQPKPKPIVAQQQQQQQQQPQDSDDDNDDEQIRNEYGEQLYAKIVRYHPKDAGKIVGMLLELEIEQLDEINRDNDKLNFNVAEALKILLACVTNNTVDAYYEEDNW